MQLKSFKVNNYKSLKKVELGDLSDTTVFVGRNDSGKSSVLKALDLFFNWNKSYDVVETITTKSAYEINLRQPDSMLFEFTYEAQDLRLFHHQMPCVVKIEAELELGDGENPLPSLLKLKQEPLRFNTNDFGNRVHIAETMEVSEKQLIQMRVSEMRIGSLLLLTIRDGRPLALTQLDDGSYDHVLNQISDRNVALKVLKRCVRGKFLLIPATRELKRETRGGNVPSADGKGVPSQYLQFEKNTSLGRRPVYNKIREHMSRIFPEYKDTSSMEDGDKNVEIFFGDYPSTGVGEGVRKYFLIAYEIDSNLGNIIGVEEPEIHFHPSKQRELYDFIVEHSTTRQVFITTHSPVIATKSRLSDLFLVTIDANKVTTIEHVTEDLVQTVIDELGIKQSDFFDSDCVAFVEGKSDAAVFATITSKLHPELKISFLDSEGWGSMEYYANARILESRKVTVAPFAVFDGDTRNDVRNNKARLALTNRLHLPANQVITLKKNSIEDYLLVPRAIWSVLRGLVPSISASQTDIANFIAANSGKKGKNLLDDMFRQYGGIAYKEAIHAVQIAKVLTPSEIDPELSGIITTISEISSK